MYELELKNYELISKKCNDNRLMSILNRCCFKKEGFKLYDIELTKKDTIKLYAYLKSLPRFKEIEKENNRNYQRKYRLMKKVQKIIYNDLDSYFMTLTFNDDFINDDFNKNKRRVIRYLKKNAIDYVANADLGKKKKRLHFHAIINSNNDNFECFKYGFMKIQYIKYKNDKRLTNYVDKLVNHSIKDTTINFKVISSRN